LSPTHISPPCKNNISRGYNGYSHIPVVLKYMKIEANNNEIMRKQRGKQAIAYKSMEWNYA